MSSCLFHTNHGRRVQLDPDGKVCSRKTGLGSKWCYSMRDIKENEIISIRVSQLSNKASKKPFIIGFTDEDPRGMPRKPKAGVHMCNAPFILAAEDTHMGALIVVTYDIEQRLVYLGVDGELKGIHSLWGLSQTPRWLAVRLGGVVNEIQMHASPDGQWGALIIEAARISKVFKETSFFNHGATGIQEPQLTFQHTGDPRVNYEQEDRIATIQGSSAGRGLVLYTSRKVLLNELVSLQVSRVCYGTTIEILPISKDPHSHTPGDGHEVPIICKLSHDETLYFICTEKGILVQGARSHVQSSTRFMPIGPVWLRFKITSPATFLKLEFEDPHRLPAKASLRGNSLVVKNRAFSRTEVENTTLCKICYKRRMDTVLSPCHHLSMCGECTRTVMEKINWTCPTCQEEVTGVFVVSIV